MEKKDELQAIKPGRRNFLKTMAVAGAIMAMPPIIGKANAAKKKGRSEAAMSGGQRTLGSGKFSMKVSELGFGCMGASYNRGIHPDKKAMIKLFRETADRGVTLFDTAEVYGPFANEELAGEALSSYKNKVAVTTKFGHEIINGKGTGGLNSRPERIKEVAEASLKRLKIDTIELFYQHRFDPSVPIEDVAGAVQDLIKEGKVKRFGLCEVSPEIIRRAHAVQPVTAIQSEYHLMWRTVENNGVLDVCEELGIGFVPYSPINRGFLGGAINEYTNLQVNDNRGGLPRFTPEAIRANTAFLEVINAFGRTRGMTTAQVSMAWLLAKKPWIVPIPGTTKLSHMEENLRTSEFKLSAQDITELEDSLAKITIVGDRYPASEQSKVSN